MWELDNRTSLSAARRFLRDRDGSEVLIVIVKGTYTFGEGGAVERSREQAPIHDAPVYAGDPAATPLLYETDLCLRKPATDVILHGTAHAPRGGPTIAMEVGFDIGPLAKRLAIIGDRCWMDRGGGPELGDPAPFTTMPLGWERGYGGYDDGAVEERNPCGVGFAMGPSSLVGKRAPNLERPGALPVGALPARAPRPVPCGFGPIARSWQPRLALAGTFDEAWQKTRMPLLPVDYDERFEQCAPEDQQVAGHLKGGERIELFGMSPSGTIRTHLPFVRLRLKSSFGGRWVPHQAQLHTVVLEPDRRRMILTWHSALPCHSTLYGLRRIVVDEERVDA